MTSAVKNINTSRTLNTRVFHWGNLQREKTPKAIVIHLINEMIEFFKNCPTLMGLYHIHKITKDNFYTKNTK